MTKLNDKQERFCMEYIVDYNGTQAAIRSGYSAPTAGEQASRLLKDVRIKEKIDKLKIEVAEKISLDATWVMKRFKDISDRCMTAEPVMKFQDGVWIETGEYQFDSSGANKATEMIGKMIGVFEVDNKQKNVSAIKFIRE